MHRRVALWFFVLAGIVLLSVWGFKLHHKCVSGDAKCEAENKKTQPVMIAGVVSLGVALLMVVSGYALHEPAGYGQDDLRTRFIPH